MSFLLKAMERLVDRYIRDRYLRARPLHQNQFAYRPGRSCEVALHHLVSRIEATLQGKEIALGAFLDIEGAFSNTSFESMINALVAKEVNPIICNWVNSMLSGRIIKTSLLRADMAKSVTAGCPQGGVLSPLLWNLVVDELLMKLNGEGYYTQGYADDIVVLIRGKFPSVVTDVMQSSLHRIEEWCSRVNLKVNPEKTVLIPFTKQTNLRSMKSPSFFGEKLVFSDQVKYLGITLDPKLTWNKHVEKVINRAKISLVTVTRACGKTWGFKPKISHWLYTAVIRPSIIYAAVVWWPKVTQRTTIKNLARIQRLAELITTGAISSTPTAALDAILNLPPLDIFIKGEARMASYRMSVSDCWNNPYVDLGHSKISKMVNIGEIGDMISDYSLPEYHFEKPFQITISSREEWKDKETEITSGPEQLTWYTDGSKTEVGTGAGVYGYKPRKDLKYSLGKHMTVFQAEASALHACVRENLRKKYKKQKISIFTDSQAVLRALLSCSLRSQLIRDCHKDLVELAKQNDVKLFWVPGHRGIPGNEGADCLARAAAAEAYIGPEPFTGISGKLIRTAVNSWVAIEHTKYWNSYVGSKHCKGLIRKPSKNIATQALGLKKSDLRIVMGLLTGHCTLKKHMHKMGIHLESTECRLCGLSEETAWHVIHNCEALSRRRFQIFGTSELLQVPTSDRIVSQLVSLVKGTGLFS